MSVKSLILPDGRSVKTGRVKPKARPQSLHWGNYLSDDPTGYPTAVDYATPAKACIASVLLNDRKGCCVISDTGHGVGVYDANELGLATIPTDREIAAAYQSLKAGPGDSGCIISHVLDVWAQVGITLGGRRRKIDGYVAVDWRKKGLVMAAIDLNGGCRFGIDLPEEWYNTPDGGTWNLTNSAIVGGHDVRGVQYDEDGVWVATWGGKRLMPWAVVTGAPQIDEAYTELSPDWYAKAATSPTGLDAASLKADLALIGQGNLPPIVSVGGFDFSNFAA